MSVNLSKFQSVAVSLVAALFVASACVTAAVGPVAPILV